jgi:putative SOS response-associated peptidase YedK
MCYAYATHFDRNKLKQRYGLADVPLSGYHFFNSAFNRPLLPVITGLHPASIHLLSWGLVPHWVRNPEQADEMARRGFNARAETVVEKPMFRDAFRNGRCLIPASGFYEWRTEGKNKFPFFIYPLSPDGICSLAGICTLKTDPDTGEEAGSFSILTAAADDRMAWIHNSKVRMPLILHKEDETAWLEGNDADANTIIQRGASEEYAAYPVSKLASSARTNRDTAEVCEPFTYPELNLPW